MRVRSTIAAVVMTFGLASLALAAEGHGSGPNMDFVWRLMNFALVAVVLFIVLRKPLVNGLKGRSQGIADELADLEKKRDEARRQYAEMEKRLADAQGERDTILAEFVAQGEREKEKIISGARALAERIKEQAQFTIDQETAEAKIELRREVAEMSAGLAEDLLREKITAEDQSRLVGDYLSQVEQKVQ